MKSVTRWLLALIVIVLALLGPTLAVQGVTPGAIFLPVVIGDPLHGAHWATCTRVLDGETIVFGPLSGRLDSLASRLIVGYNGPMG
jgi:hypothetical protein